MTLRPQPPRSRLEPEPIPRRDWLGWSSLSAMAGALLFGFIGMIRMPKAAVLPSPSKKFKVDLPENLPAGEPFVPPGRAVAVFKDAEGVYAISLICTHLGCVVKATPEGFECPCHGSRFHADGTVARGPAPQPLPWLKVGASGRAVTIDEGAAVRTGTKAAS